MIEYPNKNLDFWRGQYENAPSKDVVCPRCSQHLSDLNETYFGGCPECYNVFAPHIERLVLKYHGKASHIGKRPSGESLSKARLERQLAELSRAEKEAVMARDYLRAEEIKHQIKSLRGQE